MFSTKDERYAFMAIIIAIAAVALIATIITHVVRFRNQKCPRNDGSRKETTNNSGAFLLFNRTTEPDVETATRRVLPEQISEPSDVRMLNEVERQVVETSEKETYAQAQRDEVDKARSPGVFCVVDGSHTRRHA